MRIGSNCFSSTIYSSYLQQNKNFKVKPCFHCERNLIIVTAAHPEDHYSDPSEYEEGDHLNMPHDFTDENDQHDDPDDDDDDPENPYDPHEDSEEGYEHGNGMNEHGVYDGGMHEHMHGRPLAQSGIPKKKKKKKKLGKGKGSKLTQKLAPRQNSKSHNENFISPRKDGLKIDRQHKVDVSPSSPSASVHKTQTSSISDTSHQTAGSHSTVETTITTASQMEQALEETSHENKLDKQPDVQPVEHNASLDGNTEGQPKINPPNEELLTQQSQSNVKLPSKEQLPSEQQLDPSPLYESAQEKKSKKEHSKEEFSTLEKQSEDRPKEESSTPGKDSEIPEKATDPKQPRIKMSKITDPDPNLNELLQSVKFTKIRETHMREYLNSHFQGQDLQDDVLVMIDNLITSNLRNELKNKDSRLNKIMNENEEKESTEESFDTSREELPSNVENPGSAAIPSSAQISTDTPNTLQQKVEQSASSYIEQAVLATPGLSSIPTETFSNPRSDISSSTVSELSTQSTSLETFSQYSMTTVEEPVKTATDIPKVKRKNFMKQALKGMHLNSHHHDSHHPQDGHHPHKHDSDRRHQETEELTRKNEEVKVHNIPSEIQTEKETIVEKTHNNKENMEMAETKNIIPDLTEKTESKQEIDAIDTESNKEQQKATESEIKTPAPSETSIVHTEELDILPRTKNIDVSSTILSSISPDVLNQVEEFKVEQIATAALLSKEVDKSSEDRDPMAPKSDVIDDAASVNNSKDNDGTEERLPDQHNAEGGTGEKGFLGGLFDYFSSEISTDEKSETEKEKPEAEITEIESDEKTDPDVVEASMFSNGKEGEVRIEQIEKIKLQENIATPLTESKTSNTADLHVIKNSAIEATVKPVVETAEKPSVEKPESTEKPSVEVTESTEKPSVETTESTEKPSVETTESTEKPLDSVSEAMSKKILVNTETEKLPDVSDVKKAADTSTTNKETLEKNDVHDMLKTYRESVNMDHEKEKYLPTHQSTEKHEDSLDALPPFKDDDPLKKLCQTHPTLQACKRKTETHPIEPLIYLASNSQSTASYIKAFTRWMNKHMYTIFIYVFSCLKVMLTTILNYSIGMLLVVTGQAEASRHMSLYFDSISVESFSLFMIILGNHIVFYWYYKNSSMGPVVKSISRPETTSGNDIKVQELHESKAELEEKLFEEAKQKEMLQKKVTELEAELKEHNEEIEDLKIRLKEEEEGNKETIKKLQTTTDEYKETISSKENELNHKISSLESTKEDLNSSKTEYKQLEEKFFYLIKELDVKDLAFSKLEKSEKELQNELSENKTNLSEKEETIDEQKIRIGLLLEEKLGLENNIEEEQKKSRTLELEMQVLQESLLAVSKTHVDHETSSEFETVEEDEEIDADQLKADRLAKIIDATKTRTELKELKSEFDRCKEELSVYKKRNTDVEEKYVDVSSKYNSVYSEAEELRKSLEKKEIQLTTIQHFFSDRENDFQKTSMSQTEEIRILKKQVDSIGDNDKQINILMKQVQDLKDEILKNEKDLKQQISIAEEQSHNSYIKMRTAVRECDEHKREKEIYRKRLLDIDMSPQFKKSSTPIGSKTVSERAVSPTNSNKSTDDNSGTESPRPSLPPPLGPSPYAPRMYPGMPPPFQPRPPFGMPMGPYGGPPRPPFMSPMNQRVAGMTMPPTSAAAPKADELQREAIVSDQRLVNPTGLPPHMASPLRPMGGMYRMPPGTPPMVRPPYGMPPGTPPMMRPPMPRGSQPMMQQGFTQPSFSQPPSNGPRPQNNGNNIGGV